MKIKTHHTNNSTACSQADDSSNSTHVATGAHNSSSNNSSQIWTRSAVRAAQQQQRLTETCSKHKHYGHVIGKIVKPIPVRPMSSSSSSSSTHSSHFSHVKSIHSNLSSFGAHLRNEPDIDSPLANSNQSFSLIAKYFASFPSSRLAKTQIFSESSNSIVDKSTPFMPFKKTPSNSGNSEHVHSTFVLRSQTGNLTNTDHLCTNFRRMIKLNESAEFRTSPFNHNSNPSTHASNTPTGSDINYAHLSNNNQGFNFNIASTSNDDLHNASSLATDPSYFNENENMYSLGSKEEDPTASRLGQITMETRSTRKFLIKHHPYLQQTNSSTKSQQRPSINLMKKLNSKKLDESCNSHQDSSNNRSGRSSRSNNSTEQAAAVALNSDHHNLLKFTDTAPIFSSTLRNATSTCKQTTGNTSSLAASKARRRQLKSLTTASALSNELNLNRKPNDKSHSRSRDKQQANNRAELCDVCCDNCNNEEQHENLCDNSYEQYCDEQEEDSSGYYSSYHSVDLISSSGGSCIAANQIVNRESKKNDWQQVKHSDSEKNISPVSHDYTKRDNTNNTSIQVPQHHYNTRSLTHCLEQRQDPTLTSSNHQTKGTIQPQSAVNLFTSTSTTPTTRLRYQQQLAAQAATGKFSSSLECDLDLDQIEND